jgi:hypothetical protein
MVGKAFLHNSKKAAIWGLEFDAAASLRGDCIG